MRETNISFSIPRYREEQSVLKECARSLDAFLDLCENAPEKIREPDLQSFFDTYTQMETIQKELSLSEWPNGREISNVAKDILMRIKSKFDELGICIQCEYDNNNVEILKGFDKIRTVF
jgi:hypothetical protein